MSVDIMKEQIRILELQLCSDLTVFANNTTDDLEKMIYSFREYARYCAKQDTLTADKVKHDWKVSYIETPLNIKFIGKADSEGFPYSVTLTKTDVNEAFMDTVIRKFMKMISVVKLLHLSGESYETIITNQIPQAITLYNIARYNGHIE